MLNSIGFFQLDNLIKSRIPFFFINMGPSLVGWYTSIFKMHVETYEILAQPEEALSAIEERKTPKDFAIVIACEDGQKSQSLFHELETKGYTNVYLVNGGHQQLVTERDQV
ncbi:MAG: rhodanese-like domain-containing protein [Bdellovibrionaceae bacterium]|nr:rhodanese-like domain-containing protein [Bdellovibrio sp.]